MVCFLSTFFLCWNFYSYFVVSNLSHSHESLKEISPATILLRLPSYPPPSPHFSFLSPRSRVTLVDRVLLSRAYVSIEKPFRYHSLHRMFQFPAFSPYSTKQGHIEVFTNVIVSCLPSYSLPCHCFPAAAPTTSLNLQYFPSSSDVVQCHPDLRFPSLFHHLPAGDWTDV